MKKLVYFKAWRESEKPNVVCVYKSNKEEITTLFENFKYKVDIVDFNDDKSIAITNNDFNANPLKLWIKVFETLLENGYELTSAVLNRFEWCKKQIQEKLEADAERVKQKEIKRLKEKEELEKELSSTILWCWEDGCKTTLSACKRCRFSKRGVRCEPKKAIIEKIDGKEYVRILR